MKLILQRVVNKKRKVSISTLFFILFTLLASVVFSPAALAADAAIELLSKMNQAVQTQNYRMYFLTQEKDQYVTTYEYSHLGSQQNDRYAHLLYLEGPAKEIILHNGVTSYFQPDSTSFSISSSRITEAFPDVIYNNFNELSDSYDFVLIGKTRTANRTAQLVRIVAKDKDRYSYVIWIDDETHLPIRIDLTDLNNELVQQIKVIELDSNFDKKKMKDYINTRNYPILLAIEKQDDELDNWHLLWLPKGFKEIAAYNVSFYSDDIATKLYSDGVFSFTVNISDENIKQSDEVIQQGARTIFSTHVANKNVVIIGNLPLTTIEQIARNIAEKPPQ